MPVAHHRDHPPTRPGVRLRSVLVVCTLAVPLLGVATPSALGQATPPTVTQPPVTQPQVTQPPPTQPPATEPVTTTPTATEPATTQPSATETTAASSTDTTVASSVATQPPSTASVFPATTGVTRPRTTLPQPTTTLYLLPGIVGGVTLPARSEPQTPKPQNADLPGWALWLFGIGVGGAGAMLLGQWLGTSPRFATRANGLLRR